MPSAGCRAYAPSSRCDNASSSLNHIGRPACHLIRDPRTMGSLQWPNMHKSIIRSAFVAAALAAAAGLSVTARAQWLKYPTAGVPKTPAGKPNLSAPAPKTPDGKPDFSGIWLTDSTTCKNADPEKLTCGSE